MVFGSPSGEPKISRARSCLFARFGQAVHVQVAPHDLGKLFSHASNPHTIQIMNEDTPMKKTLMATAILFCSVALSAKDWQFRKIEVADDGYKQHVGHSILLKSKVREGLTLRTTINGEHTVLESQNEKWNRCSGQSPKDSSGLGS